MVKKEVVLGFLEYLKTPVDIAGPKVWKPKEIEVIKEYQRLAPEFFADLKADKCLNFQDVFPTEPLEAVVSIQSKENALLNSIRITINISNKLPKSSQVFEAEEQWSIFLSLYLSLCELVKNLFSDSIRKINKRFATKKRKRLKSFITLGPLIWILRNYKKGKYSYLFSEVDVDLRNAAAHFSYEFLDDRIKYGNNKTISTLHLLLKYRKISALLAILYASKTKAFAPEFERLAQKIGLID